jgi:predicted nucleic acid-binding protein
MPRVYLDACCLNRPFDDQRQARVRLEAEAVVLILGRVESGSDTWIGSEVLEFEINQIPDPERRRRVQAIGSGIQERIIVGDSEIDRARQLAEYGLGAFDAAHVACAETAGVDVFLTTDDKLIRKARAHEDQLRVRVINPVVWLSEVSE